MDWQQIVDDPVAWGNGEDPDPARYAYKRNVMNDVHMSHAMEFPYPMSMANCTTCHEGQMDKVTADEFFTGETCKSCHGIQARPEEYNELTFYEKKAPSMETIWEEEGVASLHSIDANCLNCHSSEGGFAPAFSELHNGYDPKIYNADGERYSDLYVGEITSLSMADGMLDIRFTGNTDLMTAPQLYISFYGWGAKQHFVPAHDRDANGQRMEYTIGSDHPLFTEEDDSAQGNWHVVLDTTAYASDPTIAEMIEDGTLRKLEVSLWPRVKVDDMDVATTAVTETLDLASNAIVDDYFKGANAVVDVAKCNVCHDALATTFHYGRVSGGSITMCKNCHVPSSGGSHLEMQSREIAAYAHAIHSFQPFDTDEVDFTDPVQANIYELHIEHTFPNFTIKNCEACHTEDADVYSVPDQSESLAAVTSASWEGIVWENGEPRNIGSVPSYVVGPASKACGACHRAEYIKEDEAGHLASFNQHTKAGGYLVEEGDWEAIVTEIMEMFN